MFGSRPWRNLVPLPLLILALAVARAEQPRDGGEDPLPLDSQWKGKLTQGGKSPDGGLSPPELKAILTITQRSGQDFEAELREYSDTLDITFLVRGRVLQAPDKSLSIEFQSHGVKGVPNATIYYLNVPYAANLTGDSLKGAWTFEEKESDTSLAGEFSLKRSAE